VQIFKKRQQMDNCSITTTLEISADNQIIGINVMSENTCSMALSGGAVLSGNTATMETYGSETTAWK
jgi:hypothetical protein